jgi:hypothetical protein
LPRPVTTATAIGVIISVVAVLDIHIDRNAVTRITANTIRRGSVPTRDRANQAIRRCSPQRSNVAATRKPPMKRNTAGFAYGAAVFSIVLMPDSGNATSGSSAVIPMGMASVSHSSAISRPTKAVNRTAAVKSPPAGASSTRAATATQARALGMEMELDNAEWYRLR